MASAKEITGVVYRVKHLTGGWLVEVPETEDPIEALAKFVAKKSIKGYIITSVTRIFACSKDTPRMAILSSKEYKEEINRLMEEAKKKPKERAKTLDELKDRIDTAGWSCSESKDENTGDVELELGRMSPAGEDFYIYVCGQTVEALISNLDNQACDFDEDDHVKLVMNMRGAPDLAALVKDAADIHEMLRKLSDTVCGR
ncbi:hypothetical protein [Flavonifractor sp. An306]|uniref:hypothetical protein n=1 Tax=Flavonifractor sp. An306 TaxID=1965629 RepID=UPI00174BDF30|nr:hypothetical protein [Flavonifractor sp. An306]